MDFKPNVLSALSPNQSAVLSEKAERYMLVNRSLNSHKVYLNQLTQKFDN